MSTSRRPGRCAAPTRRACARVLYTLAEVLRHLGILMQPFVPGAAVMLLDQLAVPPEARRFVDLADALPPGRSLAAPQGIFPRFVEADAAIAVGTR